MIREDLITNLADRLIDQMDMQTLCEIAMVYLTEQYEKLTDEQLITEAKEYAPDLLEDEE